MEIGDRFCLDGIQGHCCREIKEGCETCPSSQIYKECIQCGDDSSFTAIGDDNLCSACRILNDES